MSSRHLGLRLCERFGERLGERLGERFGEMVCNKLGESLLSR